jgi:hypothetical protein
VIATPLAYAQDMPDETTRAGDTSSTRTDQNVKQKNIGSGESRNFNCSENQIKAGVEDRKEGIWQYPLCRLLLNIRNTDTSYLTSSRRVP